MMVMKMIQLKNVSKFYYNKGVIASGFSKVNLTFKVGEFVAITGESGSGKSTLLNVISGLDSYEEGEMYINGLETSHYLPKDWEEYRRKYIGNIYQNFNLVNSYTVYQNIDLVLSLNGMKRKDRKNKIISLLKRVDMLSYKNTKVSKLSGGQKQRVAIARALAKDVPIIIADEPTGNLDKKSAIKVIELLREISSDKLVIIVTHNYEQVSEYITRKITMFDGKIVEDTFYKKINNDIKIADVSLKKMSLWENIRLGIRNTFNIIPKFLLLLLVYVFVVCSLMGEYSSFKKSEYEANKNGLNYVFTNHDDHRIVVNKKDGTFFNQDELVAISKIANVKNIIHNDLLLDETLNFATDKYEMWLSGQVHHINEVNYVDYGRMPINNNEMVIEVAEDNSLFTDDKEAYINKDFYIVDKYTNVMNDSKTYKIVGIKYMEPSVFSMVDYHFYVNESTLNEISLNIYKEYSKTQIDFMGKYYDTTNDNNNFKLVANQSVPKGKAYISENYDVFCDKENCLGKKFYINVSNIYYKVQKELIIENKYNSKNINHLLKLPEYKKDKFEENYNGIIFINEEDYRELFDRDTYQISVFVNDYEKIDATNNYLNSMGYNTLCLKDVLSQDEVIEFLKIFKLIITIILVIVLFFIAYFVIKIILKSRNSYYAIIRMLGGSKGICRLLLIVELFVISNISYFSFVFLILFNKINLFEINLLDTVNTYFRTNDYIILYLIISIMSIVISMRYAQNLFKDSAMNIYREEV